MSSLDVTFLGIVQGLTEFLPVSSSGHLVAARLLLGFSDTAGGSLDAFLHLGTLLAVFVYFWRSWWGLLRSMFSGTEDDQARRQLLFALIVATVPAALTGYFLQGAVNGVLRQPEVVAGGLLLTALALAVVELVSRRDITEASGEATLAGRVSFSDAFLIGLAQILSLVPGVSRSGITIAAGCSRGFSRREAVIFSFLMSAPIIAGAGLASLSTLLHSSVHAGQLFLGLIVSFVSGLAAIRLLLVLIQRITFWPFVAYLIVLASIVFHVR